MKTRFFLMMLALMFAFANLNAAEKVTYSDEDLDYAEIVNSISKVGSPYLKGDYVIFTADKKARHVGIAFDFEEFKTIHSFKVKKVIDMEYNEADSLYFYILRLPKNILSVNYRLVIDGLWTTDPSNADTKFSYDANLVLSHFDASRYIPPATRKTSAGSVVHFVCKSESGQKIRLGGSFTNWDSWIYMMKEVEPGLYEFDLPLPPGTYEYAFYSGITSFPDISNPQRCYTADGKTASLIIVD